MFGLGIQEIIIVGAVAVILFGKRLPDVARSLGSSYRDFRRGLSDIQSEINISDVYSNRPSNSPYSSHAATEDVEDYEQPTAPRFELPAPPSTATESPSESDRATDPMD